ncbi:uncharacterized protein LOC122565147 [Chiloscyllium plagiosum]|uniref:uncharacterized protein LOC122565147 n=1 Tax=Chiloscyllium plagiosum TaxID=36176 RepID=UPI001CB839ED|nr:uncharacterized protein LOC122565147 [Chiloscyllium plagiosum]
MWPGSETGDGLAGQTLAGDRERKREERKQRPTESLRDQDGARAGGSQQRVGAGQSSKEHLEKVENVVTVVVKVVEKVVGELVEKLNADGVVGKLEEMREGLWRARGDDPSQGSGQRRAPGAGGGTGEAERDPECAQAPSTLNQQKAFHQVFDILTARAGGQINLRGFQSLLRDEGFVVSEAKGQKAFRCLDDDRDRQLGFDDLCQALTNSDLFLRFVLELPDSCPTCEVQKGYVGDSVFFEILLKLLARQVISEDSAATITRHFYLKMRRAGLNAKGGKAKAVNSFLGMPLRSIQALIESSGPDEVAHHGHSLPGNLVVAFFEVFQMLTGDHGSSISSEDLQDVMYQMQIPLRNPLIPDELKFGAVNGGREVDFEAFLSIMSDQATFAAFLAPQCPDCRPPSSPELLPFRALLKLVAPGKPALKARSKAILASYFHEKFRALPHPLPVPAPTTPPPTAPRLLPDSSRDPEPEQAPPDSGEGQGPAAALRRDPSCQGTGQTSGQRQGKASSVSRNGRGKRLRYRLFKPTARDPYLQQVFQEYLGASCRQHKALRYPTLRHRTTDKNTDDTQQTTQS